MMSASDGGLKSSLRRFALLTPPPPAGFGANRDDADLWSAPGSRRFSLAPLARATRWHTSAAQASVHHRSIDRSATRAGPNTGHEEPAAFSLRGLLDHAVAA